MLHTRSAMFPLPSQEPAPTLSFASRRASNSVCGGFLVELPPPAAAAGTALRQIAVCSRACCGAAILPVALHRVAVCSRACCGAAILPVALHRVAVCSHVCCGAAVLPVARRQVAVCSRACCVAAVLPLVCRIGLAAAAPAPRHSCLPLFVSLSLSFSPQRWPSLALLLPLSHWRLQPWP